jgi:hypothetical protein
MAASTEFIAVNWNANQLIDEDSLDQINNNVNWLKNNSLTGSYQTATGYPISQGLKILTGKSTIPGQGQIDLYQDVYFAKSFTPNSSPVVTATAWCHTHISPLNIFGLDGSSTIDHRGFRVHMYSVVNGAYTVNPIINWIAIGY